MNWTSSTSWNITVNDNNVTFAFNGTIPVNDYVGVMLYFKAANAGNISNTVVGSWNVGRNSTSVTTPEKEVLPYNPNVEVTKVVNATHAYVGDDVTYEVIVKIQETLQSNICHSMNQV